MTLIKFRKDPLRNLGGVAFTRLQYQYRDSVSRGITLAKKSLLHAHLPIIGMILTKFPIRNLGGVAFTRIEVRTDGQTEKMTKQSRFTEKLA